MSGASDAQNHEKLHPNCNEARKGFKQEEIEATEGEANFGTLFPPFSPVRNQLRVVIPFLGSLLLLLVEATGLALFALALVVAAGVALFGLFAAGVAFLASLMVFGIGGGRGGEGAEGKSGKDERKRFHKYCSSLVPTVDA
jgi:hypothetical protein